MNLGIPKYDSREDTRKHILLVGSIIEKFITELEYRIDQISRKVDSTKGPVLSRIRTSGTDTSYPETNVGGLKSFNLVDMMELYARTIHIASITSTPQMLALSKAFGSLQPTTLYAVVNNTVSTSTTTVEILQGFIEELIIRIEEHDLSKLSEPEKSILDKYTPMLGNIMFGSDKYKEIMKKMKPMTEHHYAKNKNHHPDLVVGGVAGMSLVDVVEMLCDFCASSERHPKTGNIHRSIEICTKKFNTGMLFAQCLSLTVQDFRIGKNVELI